LSYPNIARRIDGIGKSIDKESESRVANFKFYAVSIDESTDYTDRAQLGVFIRGINGKYNITKEMASLVPLKDTNKSRVLYDTVKIL